LPLSHGEALIGRQAVDDALRAQVELTAL
jgi:hypothetical protein